MGSGAREGICMMFNFPFVQRPRLFWATILQALHNCLPVLTCLNVVFLSPDFTYVISGIWCFSRSLLKWGNSCTHPEWKESLLRVLTTVLQVCLHDILLYAPPIIFIVIIKSVKILNSSYLKKNWEHLNSISFFCRSSHPPHLTLPCCPRCKISDVWHAFAEFWLGKAEHKSFLFGVMELLQPVWQCCSFDVLSTPCRRKETGFWVLYHIPVE